MSAYPRSTCNLPRRRVKTIGRSRCRGARCTDWLFRPQTERMEDRTLLATMIWDNGAGGDWDVAASWVNQSNSSDHHVPTSADDAQINTAGITVTHSSNALDAVNGLSVAGGATLNLSAGTLTIAAASTIPGNLTISGGTLTGAGTVTVAGALDWTGGTMSGAGTTIAQGGLELGGTAASTSYYEYLSGRTLDNTGAATLSSDYAGQGLYLSFGAKLDNQAGATFTFATDASILNGGGAPSGGTFANEGTLAKSGGTGTSEIGVTFNQAAAASTSLQAGTVNFTGGGSEAGTFKVNSGATLELGGAFTLAGGSEVSAINSTLNLGNSTNAWSNQGTITATNSTVAMGGDFTLAGLGSFTRSGGTVNLTGTLDATARTLALTAATGTWNLLGGTIKGGTVTEAGGAELAFTNYSGTLAGVTFDNDLDLASVIGGSATVTGGLTLAGGATVRLGNAAGSTSGSLLFSGTESLAGSGTVLFGKSAGNVLDESAPAATLTIAAGIAVRGSAGGIGGYYSSNAVVNQGTIVADDSGGAAAPFAYDTGFSGGGAGSTADAIDVSGVSNPAPQAVYQTYRQGSFTYTLAGLTPSAPYTLRLHFADPSSTAAGQRLFDVSVNGTNVLAGFDIYAAAGGKDKAVVESLHATADAQGQIAVGFAYGSAGTPLVNGIEVDAGGTVVQAVNCGEMAGGTITVNPGTFTNQGTLQAANGERCSISGLVGNLGAATISGGSALSLAGANYVVDRGLIVTAGQTLTLGGTWRNAAGSTIAVNGGTWNLGGSFTKAAIGKMTYAGGTVNLTGTLDDTGATLALTAATGTWNLLGGTIKGGTVTEAGGAELAFTNYGGTLAGVTFDNDLDLASVIGGSATVTGGLTLAGGATVRLGNAAGSTSGSLLFSGTESLAGSGTVLFGKSAGNVLDESAPAATLTIAAGIAVRGSAGGIGGYYSSSAVVNQGTIVADDSGGAAAPFAYDTGFSGGGAGSTADAIDVSGVSNPAPQAVYQTYRQGSFTYTLAGLTPSAPYTLRLHFADPSSTAAGQRLFDVSVNGTNVLAGFDIYAAAGGKDKAVVESLHATADAQGQITVGFAYGSAGTPLVNGIEVDAGGSVVQGVNCGEMAGGTITVNPGTFTNQGTLRAANGGALSVNGLVGNLGAATISGSGSSLSLGGTSYVINGGLSVADGQTLTLNGTWTNGTHSTISVNGGTLNLGGSFTTFGFGTIVCPGGTINLTGTLDNTGSTLALSATHRHLEPPGGRTQGRHSHRGGWRRAGLHQLWRHARRRHLRQRPRPGLGQRGQCHGHRRIDAGRRRHRAPGQRRRLDLRLAPLQRHAVARRLRDRAVRQVGRQRARRVGPRRHADHRGGRRRPRQRRRHRRLLFQRRGGQPGDDRGRRQRRGGRPLRLRHRLQRRRRRQHGRRHRRHRRQRRGVPGRLPDLPLRLLVLLHPGRPDPLGLLHRGAALRRPGIDGGRSTAVRRQRQRRRRTDQLRHLRRRRGTGSGGGRVAHGHGRRAWPADDRLLAGGGRLRRWSMGSRWTRGARWCRRSTAASWPAERSRSTPPPSRTRARSRPVMEMI